MSLITTDNPIEISPSVWRFTWVGTAPFYVWHRGRLIATTTETTIDVVQIDGTVPIVEIADDSADVPLQAIHPGWLVLTWRTPVLALVEKIALYRIDQYVSGAWEAVAGVTPNATTYQRYRTDYLADDTTHQFRVVPVMADGTEFDAITFTALVVRYPDVPNVTYTYSAGTITASAG